MQSQVQRTHPTCLVLSYLVYRLAAQCLNIDRLIKRLYNTREQLHNMELHIGSRLAGLMPNHTYYNLLKSHPFWFVMLYEQETGLSLGVYEKVYALQDSPNKRVRLDGHI